MLSLLSDIITPVRKRIEIALRGIGKLHGTIKKNHKMYRTTGRGGFPNRKLVRERVQSPPRFHSQLLFLCIPCTFVSNERTTIQIHAHHHPHLRGSTFYYPLSLWRLQYAWTALSHPLLSRVQFIWMQIISKIVTRNGRVTFRQSPT